MIKEMCINYFEAQKRGTIKYYFLFIISYCLFIAFALALYYILY